MSPELRWLKPELQELDEYPSDLLVISAFSDERPLEGLASLVDWRLCGAMSAWRKGGFSQGYYGERILFPTSHRLAQQRLLFLGLGRRTEYRSDRALALAEEVISITSKLHLNSITCSLLRLEGLASPLERSGPALVKLLQDKLPCSRFALIADTGAQKAIREGQIFFSR